MASLLSTSAMNGRHAYALFVSGVPIMTSVWPEVLTRQLSLMLDAFSPQTLQTSRNPSLAPGAAADSHGRRILFLNSSAGPLRCATMDALPSIHLLCINVHSVA